MATDYVFHHATRTLSTQDDVRRHLDENPGRPVMVCADLQTSGRGRSGARWVPAPRALSVSVGWETDRTFPPWSTERLPVLPLVAGLAALMSVEELGGGRLGLKWPNDLVVGHVDDLRKLGGILVEVSGERVAIGLGINLWWPAAPEGFGALFDDDVGPDLGPALAHSFAESLFRRMGSGPEQWGREEYRQKCVTLDEEITWQPGGSGRAVDVDLEGGLVVETPGGRVVLRSGEVQQVRTRR